MEHIFTITGPSLTVHLPGEIDHHSSEQLRQQIDSLVRKHHIRCVLFDFEKTEFMDSSGIGMMIGRYKMMRFMGGAVAAINVGGRMRKILTMSGIYRVIDIYEGMPQQSNLL